MNDHTRCPSSDCHTGAVLFGIVLPGGRVAFASNKIVVDEEFVRVAREQPRPPEQRFRFSTTCVRGACMQWDANLDGPAIGGCSLIDRLMVSMNEERDAGRDQAAAGTLRVGEAEDESLPECSIRDECRWYRQRGGDACAICPNVVTDMTTTVDDLPPRVRHARLASQNEK